MSEFKKSLMTFESIIRNRGVKVTSIMSEWLAVWSKYLRFEQSFSPQRLIPYKRGTILHVHFGFNVGSEIGGSHYCIVMENNNNPESKTIVIMPLSSLSHGKTKESLHHSEVYLGKIIPWEQKESYAMPLQIRAISKLRIIKPKIKSDSIAKINAEQLTELDNKLKQLFTFAK
ncbi:type II toxin-antitoxin system PemK/MazF family toxin [Sinanaerobacter chloroacetimidivorans]|uniref:Type II toxin-antitoxin system PemK/MazF family toxin n=1 Tax=Sinanaerobacter chloroacetimidivorans TaxID=2818044 RepID=A0A8J7W3I8_9FIRM|nr:type II toxin-antitoxin system PemK/MazF family toxin [Sinanaerobacter chloroacetimidivorans]MBR0598590.1 type II toxin-antitoxin system PemK/MazF family toxin [Sinanaerobacter chloroacetimidivorans]